MTDDSTEGTLYSCSEGSGWTVGATTRDEAAAIFARRLAREHGPDAFPLVLRADSHDVDGTATRYEATHVVPASANGYSPVGRSWFTVKGGASRPFPRRPDLQAESPTAKIERIRQMRQRNDDAISVLTVGVRNGATEYKMRKVPPSLMNVAPLISDHGFTFWQSGTGTYAEVPAADGNDDIIVIEEHPDNGEDARLWERGGKGLPLSKLADRVAIELENVLKLRAGQNV